MNLIKIDPSNRTVAVVESDGTLPNFYQLISCRLIDVCARQANGDALTVDDEALAAEPQPAAFSFNGFGPVHGIALVTGTDDEGGTVEPTMTVEQARSCVDWLDDVYTQPSFKVVPLYDLAF